MGIYLTTPDTKKNSHDLENNLFVGSVSSMQGWRLNMEDAHNLNFDIDKDVHLFSVFDGHGGSQVAQYCQKYITSVLLNNQNYKNGNYEEALKETFQ